jgi:hypothetical protein
MSGARSTACRDLVVKETRKIETAAMILVLRLSRSRVASDLTTQRRKAKVFAGKLNRVQGAKAVLARNRMASDEDAASMLS